MQQYLGLLNLIQQIGTFKGDRTGVGTQSIFGHQLRFNLKEGFPIVTTKFVPFKKVLAELIWLLEGSTDNERLHELGATIWDEWAITEEDVQRESSVPLNDFERYTLYKSHLANVKGYTEEQISEETVRFQSIKSVEGHKIFDECGLPRNKTYAQLGYKVGDLGPIYGKQWRSWACKNGTTIDQISEVIEILKTKPDSRRMVVSAWNPADLPDESKTPHQNVLDGKASLASCHTLFQFYTSTIPLFEVSDLLEELGYSAELQEVLTPYLDGDIEGLAKATRDFAVSKGVPIRKLSCQLYQRKQNCAFVA